MTEHKNLADALLAADAADVPPGPWASDAEVEIRRELADIRAHQLRQDKLIMELQLENRRISRQTTDMVLRLESKIDSLVSLLRSNGNGHG